MTQFRSQKAAQEYLANRGKITLLFSGVVLTVSVLLFFYIWQFTKMVEIQIAIREVRKKHNRQNEQLEGMQVERAKLTAMARIEQLARVQLGMVPPSRDNIQFLGSRGMVVAPKDRPIESVPTGPENDPHFKDKPREASRDRPAEPGPGSDNLSEQQLEDTESMYKY